MARQFTTPIALPADPTSPLQATTKQYVDAADATKAAATHTHAEADVTSLTSDLAAKAPTTRQITAGTGLTGGGDLTADRTLTVAFGATATTVAAGNHNHDSVYVPLTQRGPIGGVVAPSYAATVTPDATAGVHFRYVATADMAVAVPTGGTDGQRILVEIQASGAARTVTFNGAYEVSAAVPSNVLTVSSGQWGYVAAVNRSGTWRLVSADPVTVSIDGSAITTGTVPVGRMPTNATAASTIAGTADVQIFTTAGTSTWTKPTGATSVHVVCIAGGGGGGGGGRAPSGTAYSGGAGGSGGAWSTGVIPASALAATESVVVGAGGTGGVASTTSSTGGSSGSAGGNSSFGTTWTKVVAYNGVGGGGGGTGASAAGGGNAGTSPSAPGAGGAVGAAGSAGNAVLQIGGAGGGGSAAGLAATQAALAGGSGGQAYVISVTGPAGGGSTGTAAGTNGFTAGTNLPVPGSGGGGGGSRVGAASGSGGSGGLYGGGGGGGATSANGQVAGTGGAGAAGIVVVTTYF